MTDAAKPGPGGTRPGAGRPPLDLHKPIAQVPDGQGGTRAVSRLDRVREVYRVCGFDKDAAARCGVGVDTYRGWLRDGTRLRAAIAAGTTTRSRLRKGERDLVELAETVEQAETEGRLTMLALAEQLSRGGIEMGEETVVESVTPQGNTVTERRRKTSRTLPDGAMIRWRLERRFPEDFGTRRLEVTGAGGGPVKVETSALDSLVEALDRIASTPPAPSTNGHAPAPAAS
jgi:transposase